MKKENGVYTVPCKVNGLNLRFIFDTGASAVCISLSEAVFMLKNGYLDVKDIVGSGKSKIADGSIIENTRIILRDVAIGGLVLNNIEAVVVPNIKAPLLFGLSAIDRLGEIRILGDKLIIGNAVSDKPNINIQNSFFGFKFGDNAQTVKDYLKRRGYAIVNDTTYYRMAGHICYRRKLEVGHIEFGTTSFDAVSFWFICDHLNGCSFNKKHKDLFDATNSFNRLKQNLENKYGLFKHEMHSSYGYRDNAGGYVSIKLNHDFTVWLFYQTKKYDDSKEDEL
jgi:clan AA aspartic protease (TIGR02281 family)